MIEYIILTIVVLYISYKAYKKYRLVVLKKPDYCTFFFEGCWAGCCWQHDEDCLMALEHLSPLMRQVADLKLYQCVLKKGYPKVAKFMYFFVRLWAHTFWWFNYFTEKYFGRLYI
jgi:hypothetical protein